jgi:hypothetical protein
MDIYHYLIKDHRKVSSLFKKIIAAKSAKERVAYFLEIKKELTLHADSEHSTFYVALRKSSKGQKDAKHGDKEHVEIKKSLAKLSKIPATETSKWLVQCGELKHLVDHHVDDEETRMFKDAKKVISHKKAIELAEEMDELKVKIAGTKQFLRQFPQSKSITKTKAVSKRK